MKTILLADDEDSLRTLVYTTLEDSGFEILEASDGDEALSLARARRPDLLVLDWMMPGLTGVEVTAVLRQEDPSGRTPIILLTAKSQQDDIAAALKTGVTTYLLKPFSPAELLTLVESLLSGEAPPAAAKGILSEC